MLGQRELPALPTRPLALSWISGAAEGAEPLAFDDSGAHAAVVIPIGTETAILCFLSRKHASASEWIRATIENASRGVDVRSLEMSKAAYVGGNLAIFYDMRYEEPAEKSERELKVMFYDHPSAPMLCTHHAIGYRATFERITMGLAASLRAGTEPIARQDAAMVEMDVRRAGWNGAATESDW
jgi:hypothetical protein